MKHARSAARALCIQALYQLDFGPEDPRAYISDFLLRCDETDGQTRSEARSLAYATVDERERIDRLISEASQKWNLNRIAAVDRAILRLGVCELLLNKTAPKIVLDEAIELAKAYSTKESGQFVNGVLDAILNRPDLEQFRNKTELPAELA